MAESLRRTNEISRESTHPARRTARIPSLSTVWAQGAKEQPNGHPRNGWKRYNILGWLLTNVGVRTWNLEGIEGCERLYKALRMWVCEREGANVGVRTWGCVRGGANVGVRTWGCVRLYKALRMYDRANLHSSSVHHIYI